MQSQAPREGEQRGRILRFRARTPARPTSTGTGVDPNSPVEDIDKFTRTNEPDDYRHRMKMNALAIVFIVALIGCGVWIVDTMAQLRKNQDCALTGRRNCVSIEVPNTTR